VLKEALGDRVLPVFHQGEHPDRLAEVMEVNPSYICISPQNQLYEELRWRWARNVHARLDGAIKTHGLATTGGEMMEGIPWRSVDSTRWVMTAAVGSVLIPTLEGQLETLPIGTRMPSRRKIDERMLKKVSEICAELSDERFTLTPDMLGARDTYRYLFNAHVMTEWSKRPHAPEVLA
jgi:hypothetical protein